MRSGVRRRITSKPSISGICTSRKMTSGFNVSSTDSTSRPSRHSPAIVKSLNAASNCRTPRRAAGSSSATRTVHLRFELTIWNPNFRNRAVLRRGHDDERCAIAVKRLETLARVVETVSGRWNEIGGDAGAVIFDDRLQHLAIASRSNQNTTGIDATRDAVSHRILDEMLQRERRNGGVAQRIIHIEFGTQSIGETRLLHGEIL